MKTTLCTLVVLLAVLCVCGCASLADVQQVDPALAHYPQASSQADMLYTFITDKPSTKVFLYEVDIQTGAPLTNTYKTFQLGNVMMKVALNSKKTYRIGAEAPGYKTVTDLIQPPYISKEYRFQFWKKK